MSVVFIEVNYYEHKSESDCDKETVTVVGCWEWGVGINQKVCETDMKWDSLFGCPTCMKLPR